MAVSPRDLEKNLESQADIELQQVKGIDAHGETNAPQKKQGLSAAAISEYMTSLSVCLARGRRCVGRGRRTQASAVGRAPVSISLSAPNLRPI